MVKRLLGRLRKAVEDYNMIQEGDRIAVGVSGGKDSMALLYCLKKLQEFYPRSFELEALTLRMGMGNMDVSPIQELCDGLGVCLTVLDTLIWKIVFEVRKESNPCSMCANLRRGALNNLAKELNCNKVALAHHMDDMVETALLSLFYEGRFHSFLPVTYLERKNLLVIRPFIYVQEKDINKFVRSSGIKLTDNPCPAQGSSRRAYVKNLLADLLKENRDIKRNIFGAIKRYESPLA